MEKVRYFFKKINKDDLKCILKLCIGLLPSCFLRLANKKIWLIAERPDSAEDNGWLLFNWIKKTHPETSAFYILKKDHGKYDSKDRRMLAWGSLKHYIYYLAADIQIHTLFNSTRPNKRVCEKLENKIFLRHVKQVFLQHGVTKDDYEMFTYQKRKFRLFICGAKPEYEYLSENCGYPSGYMKYTGFARFDDLLPPVKGEYILIMPTWRRYIGHDISKTAQENEQDFLRSEYYEKYQSLINSSELMEFLQLNNLKTKFYVHDMFQKYVKYFKSNSERIEIIHNGNSVHDLLKCAGLLITDYSSVFFDIAYSGKPVVYYHFDYDEFRSKHFSEGYFSYENDGVGPIAQNEKQLIRCIKDCYDGMSFIRDNLYDYRCEKLFPLHDSNNCKRIFEAIKEIECK